MSEFDRDIALNAVRMQEYAADLRPGWVVGGGVNGGYLLATLAGAVRQESAHPDPFTISAYYLSATRPGRATVTMRRLREGGSTSTYAVDLAQEGQVRISALATYGDLAALPDDVETTATPPDLPPRGECRHLSGPRTSTPDGRATTCSSTRPRSAGPTGDRADGRCSRAGCGCDDREPDALALLLAVDAMPPVTFELGRMGWAPTLELTAHVRAVPAPGWLRIRHESAQRRGRDVRGGLRGLGRRRSAGRTVPPARAPAPRLALHADLGMRRTQGTQPSTLFSVTPQRTRGRRGQGSWWVACRWPSCRAPWRPRCCPPPIPASSASPGPAAAKATPARLLSAPAYAGKGRLRARLPVGGCVSLPLSPLPAGGVDFSATGTATGRRPPAPSSPASGGCAPRWCAPRAGPGLHLRPGRRPPRHRRLERRRHHRLRGRPRPGVAAGARARARRRQQPLGLGETSPWPTLPERAASR